MSSDSSYGKVHSRRAIRRSRSDRSWSPEEQQSNSSWEGCVRVKKKRRTVENNEYNGQVFERVRGRPRGHNRPALTREEQRKRNAYYERERRGKLANGWKELREAIGSNAPQNRLLEEATPCVKALKRRMRWLKQEKSFQLERKASLKAKLAKLKALTSPEVMTKNTDNEALSQRVLNQELIQDYGLNNPALPNHIIEQEDADSGVNSAATSIRSSNPSISSQDFNTESGLRVPSPESRALALDSRLSSFENKTRYPEPKVTLASDTIEHQTQQTSKTSFSILVPYPAPRTLSPRPRVCSANARTNRPNVKIKIPYPNPKIPPPVPIAPYSVFRVPCPDPILPFTKPRVPVSGPSTVKLTPEPMLSLSNSKTIPCSIPTSPYSVSIPISDLRVPFPGSIVSLDEIPPSSWDIYDYVESAMDIDPEESRLQFLEAYYYYEAPVYTPPKPNTTVPNTRSNSSIFSFQIDEDMSQLWGEDVQWQLSKFEKAFQLT